MLHVIFLVMGKEMGILPEAAFFYLRNLCQNNMNKKYIKT